MAQGNESGAIPCHCLRSGGEIACLCGGGGGDEKCLLL